MAPTKLHILTGRTLIRHRLAATVLPFTAEGGRSYSGVFPSCKEAMSNMGPAGGLPARLRWIGGANLPATTGRWRVNATEPLAELVIDGDALELRLRGPIPRLMRAETLRAGPADVSEAFPIRSVIRFRGVGFRRPDGRDYYFKTSKIDDILDTLQARGFPVSMINQQASKLWRLKP